MANPVGSYISGKVVKPIAKAVVGVGKDILSAAKKPKVKENVKIDAPDMALNFGVPKVEPIVPPSTFIGSAIPSRPVAPRIPTPEELGIKPRATEAEVKAFLIEKEPNINLNVKENKALVESLLKADAQAAARQKVDYELTRRAIEREHAKRVAEFEAVLKSQPEFIPRAKTTKEMFETTTPTQPIIGEPIKPNTKYMTDEQATVAEEQYAQQLFERAKRESTMTNEQIAQATAPATPGNVITPEDLATLPKQKDGSLAKSIALNSLYAGLTAAPLVTNKVTDNSLLNKAANVAGIVGSVGLLPSIAKSKWPNIIKGTSLLGGASSALANAFNLFTSSPTKADTVAPPATVDIGVEGGTTETAPAETRPYAFDQFGNKVYTDTIGQGAPAGQGVAGTSSQQAQVDALLQQSIDTQVAAITGGITQKDIDDEATTQLNDLIKQYGDINKMYDSLVTGDPALTATIASIQNQYQNSTAIINKAYDIATQQITGSTEAFSKQMQSAGEAQAQANALAAGGLGATVAPTGLTAEQANASGISDTALGGAATTGSALVSALGGVAQSQNIADQLKLGAGSSDALQQAALDKAYAQTALEQNKLDAVTSAQLNDIKTRAEQNRQATIYKATNMTNLADKVYATKAAQAAAKKQQAVDIAKIKADAASTKAKYLLAMSKKEYQDFTGISANANLNPKPKFVIEKPLVGKDAKGKITKDPSAVTGITYKDTKGNPQNLTVADANNILGLVNGSLTMPEALSPDTALTYWSEFYIKNANTWPGFIDVLSKMKYPTSAQAMVNALYPTK